MRIISRSMLLCVILFCEIHVTAQTGVTKIEAEVLKVAQEWTQAWNGKIDKDRMMSQYHKDMQYIWRGSSRNYSEFENMLENFIIPYTDYDLIMKNEVITVINRNNAVVFLQFIDKNEIDPPGAMTLSLSRVKKEWKIFSAHESLVRPLPPKDFEEQFNKVSQQYQANYMNAKCEGIMPYLDEELVIFENGEDWPYDVVKEYCPKLPEKPVISTNRAYKILGDDSVYEYVSQMYSREPGKAFNETQSRIWNYKEGKWKIIKMDVSRYQIVH